jgi:hypothetical protein
MEDQTPESQEIENQKDIAKNSEHNDESAEPMDPLLEAAQPSMKKGSTHHPSLFHLAGSPTKDLAGAAIE